MKQAKQWTITGIFLSVFVAGIFTMNIQRGSAATPTGSISGVVWQDYCASDCVAGSSLKRGNGLVSTAEKRLSGIKVGLSRGKCSEKKTPKTMNTNKNGFYLFSGLKPGFYCVIVDSRQSNSAFPKPGYWTRPAESASKRVARYEINLVGATDFVNKSFGWNYK